MSMIYCTNCGLQADGEPDFSAHWFTTRGRHYCHDCVCRGLQMLMKLDENATTKPMAAVNIDFSDFADQFEKITLELATALAMPFLAVAQVFDRVLSGYMTLAARKTSTLQVIETEKARDEAIRMVMQPSMGVQIGRQTAQGVAPASKTFVGQLQWNSAAFGAPPQITLDPTTFNYSQKLSFRDLADRAPAHDYAGKTPEELIAEIDKALWFTCAECGAPENCEHETWFPNCQMSPAQQALAAVDAIGDALQDPTPAKEAMLRGAAALDEAIKTLADLPEQALRGLEALARPGVDLSPAQQALRDVNEKILAANLPHPASASAPRATPAPSWAPPVDLAPTPPPDAKPCRVCMRPARHVITIGAKQRHYCEEHLEEGAREADRDTPTNRA